MRQLIDREREVIEKSKGLNRSAKNPGISKEKSFELKRLQEEEYNRYLFFNNLRRTFSEKQN